MSGVALTSLERVLWPRTGFTKGDMVAYYQRVAPVLVPHIADRALTLGRFPGGVDAPGFAQTECRGRPPWVATVPVRLTGGEVRNYCLLNDERSLLWAVNLGSIELHPFLAAGKRPDEPLVVVFDLDPAEGADIVACARMALRLRAELERVGLHGFAKTTGSRGLHVYVPLNTPHTFDRTRDFASEIAARLGGAVGIDWRQNHPRRSTVAPYSLRTTERPLVSTPVTWEEVERGELRYGPDQVLDRVAQAGDLFRPVLELRQELPES